MSMYALLTGRNTDPATALLDLLGIEYAGRLRDGWVEMQDGKPVIAIFTRNGGGNREHYGWVDGETEEGRECGCTGCIQTHVLPEHPNYLYDKDDDFDATYCTTYFSVPDEHVAELAKIARRDG